MSASEHIKELKIDSTLWTNPKRIINLRDFDPKKVFMQNLIILVIHQTRALKIL